MNQTEAWELVIKAAELCRDDPAGLGLQTPHLAKAIKKVKPRVERMRSRLECIRARRAGKPKCPRGLEP